MLNEVTKIARCRNHPEITGQVGAGGFFRGRADHALRVHTNQAGNLRDDAFGKRAQALFGNELGLAETIYSRPRRLASRRCNWSYERMAAVRVVNSLFCVSSLLVL